MIRLFKGKIHDGNDRPGFRVLRAKNKPSYPGMNHSPHTHSAWFEGDIQIAILEPIIADFSASPSDGDNLGVGCRVAAPDGLIVSAADDFPTCDNYCPDRHFPLFFCALGFGQRAPHKIRIVCMAGRIFRFHQGLILLIRISIYNFVASKISDIIHYREEIMESLECLFCHKQYPVNVFHLFCPSCQEPLLVAPPRRNRAFHLDKSLAVEKFIDFLPLTKIQPQFSLGEGQTPLTQLSRVMKNFGLPPVFAKNETINPTASFKDRGTVVAVHKAVSLGFKKIGTVSTGNMAGSTAAYAAKAGLGSLIFVKEDTSRDKIVSAGIYGPVLFKVRGDYGQLFQKSFAIGKKYGIYFMNSVDPFRIEGYKATGFEIFLQLDSHTPQYIFVPVSAGGHLIGLMRAFQDLKEEGFIRKSPIFVGVQASGCSPLARAFAKGRLKFSRFPSPTTIAHAISNPNPPGGNIVLKMIHENKGMILDVSDTEILEAQRSLAEQEGIFCDPASATTLAALRRLSKKMKFGVRDRIVLVITGSGLKTLEDVDPSMTKGEEASLKDLEKKIQSVLS